MSKSKNINKKRKTEKKSNEKDKILGKRLFSYLQSKTDLSLIIVTILLILIGLITLLSASSSIGLSDTSDAYYFVKKQVVSIGIGIILALIFVFVDYRLFNSKLVLGIIIISIIALIILVRISGLEEGGAIRWIVIGGFNFQPSEVIKIGMIIFMAGILTRIIKLGEIKKVGKGFFLPLVIIGVVSGLIFVLQNHLSAALVIGAVSVIQMFVAGTNLICLFSAGGLGLTGVIAFVLSISSNTTDFRAERILAWRDPERYLQGKGWQIMQSLYAIGSGGLLGVGIGQSRQKQDFLPEPQNDFIASIFAEEFGFVGIVFLLILFMVLLVRSAMIAHNTTDTFGKLLATGITALFAVEIIFNLLVITNLVPVTGIGLPFFSYGGTAMVVNLIAIGILLNIHKISNRKE